MLNNNKITGEIPKEIGKLTKLKHLCVKNNKIEHSLGISNVKYFLKGYR